MTLTEIQSLDTNQAFVKVPGNLPITKIHLAYKSLPKICEPFLKKSDPQIQPPEDASNTIPKTE